MAKRKKPASQRPLPVRFVQLHGKLLGAALLGVLVAVLIPSSFDASVRELAGWNVGVLLYLVLTHTMMSRCEVSFIKQRAAEEDEGGFAVLLLSIAATAASFVAIVFLLGNAKEAEPLEATLDSLLAMSTIMLSWAFVHTIFALHYAHEYYGERGDGTVGGLKFPGNDEPDYWDFFYFSMVIGMTSQVSDIAITSRYIRRMVTAHAILSFFFNVAVLALTVNTLADWSGVGEAMTAIAQTILLMMAVLAAVAVAAKRLHVAPSILLVVAGIGMALVPGLPKIQLAPELVLLVILPPLIYSAGVAMSWREFRFNLRPIALLAFGCVVFTTCAIATAAHYVLGFDWAVGFVLGAIVAPPDVVAPLAIARRLGLPRRIVVVLEGEGLANDATALILYRFAVVAVSLGTFSLPQAAGTFALIVVGEIIYGIGVGWLSLRLRKWAREPRVEITLSLMTPYLAYWVPEHFGGSGVLATVACGLYVSWIGPKLIPSGTRLQGIFFWDLIIYLIEGFVFLLTGLQARTLIEQAHAFSIRNLVIATALTTAIAIAARFIWVFPAAYVPRWISPALAKRDPAPPWQGPFLLGFTGVRGVVSLAAALAIPYTIANGAPFPHRDLILFVTFGVIIITLVGQGLMLPLVVQWLGLHKLGKQERKDEIRDELKARQAALDDVTRRLEKIIEQGEVHDEVAEHLRTRNRSRVQILPRDFDDGLTHARQSAQIKKELIDAERDFVYQLLREGKITDEARRRIEYELDLEEAGVANRGRDGGGWI